MTRLTRLPKLLPLAILLTMLVAGVLIGGAPGFVLLLLATAFVAWVLYLAWPALTSSEKLMRSSVLLLAGVMAVSVLFPRN